MTSRRASRAKRARRSGSSVKCEGRIFHRDIDRAYCLARGTPHPRRRPSIPTTSQGPIRVPGARLISGCLDYSHLTAPYACWPPLSFSPPLLASSPAPATALGPPPRGASQKRTMKLGCGCPPPVRFARGRDGSVKYRNLYLLAGVALVGFLQLYGRSALLTAR